MRNIKNSKAQVWVETVLYTLIGIILIGLVLTFAYPKINASKDRTIVEQSINSLRDLDEVISLVNLRGPGNVKTYELTLKKGELIIDGKAEKISLILTGLSSAYSEPGVSIENGRVNIMTTKKQKTYETELNLTYSQINLAFEGIDQVEKISASPAINKFLVSNEGLTGNSRKTLINITQSN